MADDEDSNGARFETTELPVVSSSLPTDVAESDLAAPVSRDHIHHTRIIKVITYRCSNPKCKAIDRLKVFENEVMYAREWVNCWNCHAGYPQVSLETMAAKGIGMQKIQIEDREAGPSVMAVQSAREARDVTAPIERELNGLPIVTPLTPAFTVVPKGKGNA